MPHEEDELEMGRGGGGRRWEEQKEEEKGVEGDGATRGVHCSSYLQKHLLCI